jgi:hypothetical protein
MALTIKEALALLESGEAESMLKEFVMKSLVLSYRSSAENCDPMTQKAHELDLVAALAIDVLLKTPDGRRALNLKRRARGKDWSALDYVDNDEVIDIVLRFHRGQIVKGNALALLDELVSTPTVRPDAKTVERLLDDLVAKVTHNMDFAELVLMATQGAMVPEQEVERYVRAMYKTARGKK